jgi:glycosyltransferase involved in cell wall biosynthesis
MRPKRDLPKVTVIIPSYNRERFIQQTVDSILSQTYTNLEVVAVDDGSTDKTRQILDAYGERIKVLAHPERINKGQSAAINLGMRSTMSEYVGIVDSDDVLTPEKIERQVTFLEQNPSIGFVYANAYIMNDDGSILYKAFPPGHVETGMPERILLECPIGCPSGFLVRRSAFDKAGYFDESLRSAQDHDMVVRLAEVSRLSYMKETLWYYREHSESLSQRHTRRRWEAGFTILRKACKRYPYGIGVRRRRLAVLHFRLGQCLVEDGRYLAAGIRFLLAGFLDPIRGINVLVGKQHVSGPKYKLS